MVFMTEFFKSHSPESVSFSSQGMNIRGLAKVLILTTGIFPEWIFNTFFIFLNRNILFPVCYKKDQTYTSGILTSFEYMLRIKIKNKCENEDDLDLFSSGPNFIRNEIIVHMLIIKTILLEGISFSSRRVNMRALVNVLTTGIFLYLVLRNYYSLNAPNFRHF